MRSDGMIKFLSEDIWHMPLSTLPRWKAWLLGLVRIVLVVARDMADGQLNLRAMSLVYTTLLSFVPLLAVSFSVLKAFGVHNQIEPLLLELLAPLGPKGGELSGYIVEFVENMRVGVLGALGLGMLFYTVVALLHKIESALNYAWRVQRGRPMAQRVSGYLSVILIGPVLVFSALGITASVMSTEVVQQIASIQPFGLLIEFVTHLLPYLLVIAAFAFIYLFIPNTRVNVVSALVGAVVAGILWQTTGWAFASFVVTSSKYTAIYSAFATLIMFMIWLYLTWLILLLGASIAFYHQYPNYLTLHRKTLVLSSRLKEQLGLLVMYMVGHSQYHEGEDEWTADRLAERLNVPLDVLESVLQTLDEASLLIRSSDEPAHFLPARPLDMTPVKAVIDAMRHAGETDSFNLRRLPVEPAITALSLELERAVVSALDGRTLKDMALYDDTVGKPE